MFKLSQLAKFTAMYCIKAHHSIVDFKKNQKNTSDQSFITNLIPADDRECTGLPNQLHLCVGAVVMLRRNIYTADGLVNGVRGSIVGFEWKNGIAPINPLDGYMPEQILISFFDSKVGQLAKAETNFTYVPICPVTAECHGKYGSVLVRTQFPLSLSWAATIHKVQGLTLSNAVIDIGNDVFSPGMSYVALSRVKSLNGLALLSLNVGAIHCSPEVEEEMIKNSHENLNENENILEE
jgi:ATP-dependent exoDNAse (exonuclease V) alpha subunit